MNTNKNVVPEHAARGETVRNPQLAQQASMMEDREQTRRVAMDKQGEEHKKMVAQEVSQMIDSTSTPSTKPVHQATTSVHQTTGHAHQTTKHAPSEALKPLVSGTGVVGSTWNALQSAISTGMNIVSSVTHATEDVAGKLTNVAGTVGHKTAELASGAAQMISEAADNIAYKTTKTYVLAEEEAERTRRLQSLEEECALRNAMRVSELIRGRGVGLYQMPNTRYAARLLEEMGRTWRTQKEVSTMANNNAKKVAGIVVQNVRKFNSQSPLYLQSLENREQSWVESQRKLAAEAVTQEKQHRPTQLSANRSNTMVEVLEEQERSRRLHATGQQQLARENARAVSGMVSEFSNLTTGTTTGTTGLGVAGMGKGSNASVTVLEETERLRRMVDQGEQQQAQENAKMVSDMVQGELSSTATTARTQSAAM